MGSCVLVVLLVSCFIPLALSQNTKCVWKNSPAKVGIKGVGYLGTKHGVLSIYLCKDLCVLTLGCTSIDWISFFGICILYKSPPYLKTQKNSLHSEYKCVQRPCTFYKRWCAHGAECINRTCVCSPETPKGDGAFHCVKDNKHQCIVFCDPKVITYSEAVVPINLPCWYRMTEFFVYSPTLRYFYNKCRVQVHALNQLTPKGLFFVRRVQIMVWLGRQKPGGGYSYPQFASYTITLTHSMVWEAMTTFGTDFDKKPVHQLLDLSIHRDYDRNGRFAIVHLKQCWVTVKFRPFEPDKQPQTHKPGVSVTIPKGAEFPQEKPYSSVCLDPDQTSTVYEELAIAKGLDNAQEALIHNILLMGVSAQKPNIFHENNDNCIAVAEAFSSDQCEPFRAFSLKLCFPILRLRKLVHCFQDSGINPMLVFSACMKWGCEGDGPNCNLYRDFFFFCPSTPFMTQVACDPAQREFLSQILFNNTLPYPPLEDDHKGKK